MNRVSPVYAFATAVFKAEEAKGITTAMMKDALQKSAIGDAVTAMKGSSIGEFLDSNAVNTFDEANAVLQTYIDDCLRHMLGFRSPAAMRHLATAYMEKYDIANLKIALRRLLTENEAPFIQSGSMHKAGVLRELSAARSIEDIQSLLLRCGLRAYAGIVEELVEMDQRMETAAERDLEGAYYAKLAKQISRTDDSGVLAKALGIVIDIINLCMVMRSVLPEASLQPGSYIPGGDMFSPERLAFLSELKPAEVVLHIDYTRYADMIREIVKDFDANGDIRAIERISDAFQVRLLRDLLSPRLFSSAMVFLLLAMKEWEVRTVRLVLKSVHDSLPLSEAAPYLEM